MSGSTGNSGDLIIVDDPVKNRLEADSPTYRSRLWEEWKNSILTRTQAGTKIIIIQTRWHEDDLAGHVIRTEKNVQVINIPVEAEENDILGRSPGEALCPEIGKDDKWLREFKDSYKDGMRAWNALYQGRPTSEQGNIFQRHWWQFYDTLPEHIPLKVISVDASFKGGEDNDFVAIEVWGKLGADYYLIDLIKKQKNLPDTVRAIRAMAETHPDFHSIIIEDKANGSAIISTLRNEISGIIPIQPVGTKVARANAVTGTVEAGNVYLPRFASYTDEFIEELASFPSGVHDDLVDACTQFLSKYATFKAEYKGDDLTQEQKELKKFKAKAIRLASKRRTY
jgi:predicted phage terminase large subunit-like protein